MNGRKSTNEREIDLIKSWQAAGHPPEMTEQVMALPRVVKAVAHHVNTYTGKVHVPHAQIEAEARQKALAALKTYNPEIAELSTHLGNRVQLGRFIGTNQNMSRITESRTQLIGAVARATDAFNDVHGRAPTTDAELAEFAKSTGNSKITAKVVKALRQENRRDLTRGGFEEDPAHTDSTVLQEALALLPSSLTAEQNRVFNCLYGLNGQAKTSSGNEIAKRLGMTVSKVSTLRKGIATELRKAILALS